MRRWLVFVVALGLFVAGLSAAAPPAVAAASLDLEVGYGGFVQPGRSFPVRIQARVDRLVSGRLIVTAKSIGGPRESVTVRLPVEIPGGGVKRFLVVIPGVPTFPGNGGQSFAVTARLQAGGITVAESRTEQGRSADDRELVGLLAGVRDGDSVPAATPLAIAAGVAQFVAVGAPELTQAPAALGPLGTLAADASELGRLAPEARRGVLSWMSAGGTLLVDSAPGQRVEGLPDAWQPGPAGWNHAGLGIVRLTGGAMAAGRWTGLIFPTPRRGVTDPRFGGFGGGSSVGNSLADDAGLRVPKLGWLLMFLVAYTVVVGPVLGFALNRTKRAELAWVMIPLAAIMFTAGSYAAARGLRSSIKLAHGSVIELSPAGATATSFVGVAARDRETSDVSLGDRTWTAQRSPSGFDQTSAEIELTSRGPATRLQLAGGQFGVASLTGAIPFGTELTVTAASNEDGSASGVVHNGLRSSLEEVVVVVGGRGVSLGRLEAGERRDFTIKGANLAGGMSFGPEGQLWQQHSGRFGRPPDDSIVNFSVWESAASGGGASRPAGVVTVAGWSRSIDVPIKINGRTRRAEGRTAVTTSAPVQPAGRLTDMTVRVESLADHSAMFGAPAAGGRGPTETLRYLLPPGAAPRGPLVATMPFGDAEYWDGRAWVAVGAVSSADPTLGKAQALEEALRRQRAGPGVRVFPDVQRAGPLNEITIPASAVVSGQIFVRLPAMGGAPARALTLRESA